MRRSLILDTGSLLAGDRNDPKIALLIAGAEITNSLIIVPNGCVAEAWRNGRTQANLARLFKSVNEFTDLDFPAAKRAGELLAKTSTRQPIDATVVDVAIRNAPSVIVTSNPNDVQALLAGRRHNVAVYPV